MQLNAAQRGSTRLNVAQCSLVRPLHGAIPCHSAAQRGSMWHNAASCGPFMEPFLATLRLYADPSRTPPGDLLPHERLPTALLPPLDAGWAGQPPAPHTRGPLAGGRIRRDRPLPARRPRTIRGWFPQRGHRSSREQAAAAGGGSRRTDREPRGEGPRGIKTHTQFSTPPPE